MGGRAEHKKLTALAVIVYEHYDALNYDLMTRTKWTLEDLGFGLSFRSLLSFVTYLPHDSALYRAMNPEKAEEVLWQNTALLPQLVASVVDELRMLQFVYTQAHTKKNIRNKRPKPIPRPGVEDKDTKTIKGDVFESVEAFEKKWKEVTANGKHRSR